MAASAEVEASARLRKADEIDQEGLATARGPYRADSGVMMLIILVVLLVLALGGGGFGHSRVGVVGWSPAALILVVLLAMWFTGNLHV